MSKKRKPLVLTDPLDIEFLQWVKTLPPESLPDLSRMLQALAKRWPAEETRAAALTFLRGAGYPDAERRYARFVRRGLRVVPGGANREGA